MNLITAMRRKIDELDECYDSDVCKSEKDRFGLMQQLLCIVSLARDINDQVTKERAKEVIKRRHYC